MKEKSFFISRSILSKEYLFEYNYETKKKETIWCSRLNVMKFFMGIDQLRLIDELNFSLEEGYDIFERLSVDQINKQASTSKLKEICVAPLLSC